MLATEPPVNVDDEDVPEVGSGSMASERAAVARHALYRKENDSILERYHAGELVTVPKTGDGLRALAERLMRAAKDRQPLVADNDNDPYAPIPIINASEWAYIDPPIRDWFIEGLIPSGTVTLLSGDGGVGKSLLALQIATASALGIDTLGLSPKAGGVLYVGAEDDQDEFHRRIVDICRSSGSEVRDLFDFEIIPLADRDALLSAPTKDGTMVPTELWRQVRERALATGPCLIVLDTAADLYGGDEIKRAQVRQFVAMLRRLAIETGAAVVLLSHPSVAGMQSGTGTSGSTAWSNSVRSRLYMTRPDAKDADTDLRTLKMMKTNYGAMGEGIGLRWRAGAFVLDNGLPPTEVAFVNRRHDEEFLRLLALVNASGQRVAPTNGVNYAPKILAKRPDAKGVTQKHLESAMQRLLASGTIKVVKVGPPSKGWQNIIPTAADFGPDRVVN